MQHVDRKIFSMLQTAHNQAAVDRYCDASTSISNEIFYVRKAEIDIRTIYHYINSRFQEFYCAAK